MKIDVGTMTPPEETGEFKQEMCQFFSLSRLRERAGVRVFANAQPSVPN
jgi:hypothetical protein